MRIDVKRKSYGSKLVLENVGLELKPQSFTAITGPSGCGKTTLLRLAAGIDRDYAGYVDLPGRLGMVFQEPRLLPWRKVGDNIRLVRDGDPSALLTSVGLPDVEEHYPGALSLGMARRVALARALAVDPEVLLMDEPFVSLDEQAASELRSLIKQLWRERKFTALLVTHNLEEARMLADRVVILPKLK